MIRGAMKQLVIGALTCAPAVAPALDYSGLLGLSYDRREYSQNDATASMPELRLDGSLEAAGFLVDPDVLRWRGDAGYQKLSRTYDSGTDSNAFTYGGHASLFDVRGSKLALTADASRRVTDYETAAAGSSLTGRDFDQTYGARLRVNDGIRPSVYVGGWLRDLENEGFDRPKFTQTTKALELGTQHSAPEFNYQLDYQGRWNDGNTDPVNFASHSLDLSASAGLAKGVDGFVSGRYFLRLPQLDAPNNPRYEDNRISAGARWTGPGSFGSAQYGYDHLLTSAIGLEERERRQQLLTVNHELQLRPSWRLVLLAQGGLTQDRLGVALDEAAGQTVGAFPRWTQQTEGRDLLLEAGPKVGVTEPAHARLETGYGAHARARGSWARDLGRLGFDYLLDFDWNLNGERGSRLYQSLTGEASTLFGEVDARALVTASASRDYTRLFGYSATRLTSIRADLRWRRYALSVDATRTDGLSGALADPIRGDGLLVPPGYDTHSNSVSATASSEIFTHLLFVARARYATLSTPGLSDQHEADLMGSLQYSVGLLRFALEDRYLTGGRAGLDNRTNELMIRISRAFGGQL